MLNDLEKALVRELQEGLPLTGRPFLEIAEKLKISEEEVLSKIRKFIDTGIIHRFGAAVRHRELGYVANALVVWRVPGERVREVGRLMASFPEVTHCYERKSYPGWPYNLYTMLHGRSKEECREKVERISEAAGVTEHRILFSTAELKKTSMKYFLADNK